jgi:hypothetical protein
LAVDLSGKFLALLKEAAAQIAMRFGIARQKLMVLGVEEGEVSEIPEIPSLRCNCRTSNRKIRSGVLCCKCLKSLVGTPELEPGTR